jgi:hypothetical protein
LLFGVRDDAETFRVSEVGERRVAGALAPFARPAVGADIGDRGDLRNAGKVARHQRIELGRVCEEPGRELGPLDDPLQVEIRFRNFARGLLRHPQSEMPEIAESRFLMVVAERPQPDGSGGESAHADDDRHENTAPGVPYQRVERACGIGGLQKILLPARGWVYRHLLINYRAPRWPV